MEDSGEVKEAVLEGRRPSRPTLTASPDFYDEIWELLVKCWDQQAQSRPSMMYVVGKVSARPLQLSSTENADQL